MLFAEATVAVAAYDPRRVRLLTMLATRENLQNPVWHWRPTCRSLDNVPEARPGGDNKLDTRRLWRDCARQNRGSLIVTDARKGH